MKAKAVFSSTNISVVSTQSMICRSLFVFHMQYLHLPFQNFCLHPLPRHSNVRWLRQIVVVGTKILQAEVLRLVEHGMMSSYFSQVNKCTIIYFGGLQTCFNSSKHKVCYNGSELVMMWSTTSLL